MTIVSKKNVKRNLIVEPVEESVYNDIIVPKGWHGIVGNYNGTHMSVMWIDPNSDNTTYRTISFKETILKIKEFKDDNTVEISEDCKCADLDALKSWNTAVEKCIDAIYDLIGQNSRADKIANALEEVKKPENEIPPKKKRTYTRKIKVV